MKPACGRKNDATSKAESSQVDINLSAKALNLNLLLAGTDVELSGSIHVAKAVGQLTDVRCSPTGLTIQVSDGLLNIDLKLQVTVYANVLGIKMSDAGGDVEKQLQKGAEKLKELLAQKSNAVKADPELQRLSALADQAEQNRLVLLKAKPGKKIPEYLMKQHVAAVAGKVKPSLSGVAEMGPEYSEILMFHGENDKAIEARIQQDPLVRLGWVTVEKIPLWMAKGALKP